MHVRVVTYCIYVYFTYILTYVYIVKCGLLNQKVHMYTYVYIYTYIAMRVYILVNNILVYMCIITTYMYNKQLVYCK